MKQKKSRKQIVIIIPTFYKSGQKILEGILRYVATHTDWDVRVFCGFAEVDDPHFIPASPDGFITSFHEAEPSRILHANVLRKTPGVFIFRPTFPNRRCPTATISLNQSAITDIACDHLAKQNPMSVGFVGFHLHGNEPDWSLLRKRRFLQRFGNVAHEFFRSNDNWEQEKHALGKWLNGLPKPCGILCANDSVGRLCLNCCQEIGLDVPRQVRLVGIDNDETVCEFTDPPLSSVEPDFCACGFAAAETLARMLNGKSYRRQTNISAARLVNRYSSADTTGSGYRVSRAIRIIEQADLRSITLPLLASAIGCSVRLLQKDFRALLGHSVTAEINRVRLERAKRLLKLPGYNEQSLAIKCGFGSISRLRSVFRTTEGITMLRFHKQHLHDKHHNSLNG